MITYNYDVEFAWNHIQRPSIYKMAIAYDEVFDLALYAGKDDNGIYIALYDDFEILFKEHVFNRDDFKFTFDKCINIMRVRK